MDLRGAMRGRHITAVLAINALVRDCADEPTTAREVLGGLSTLIPYTAASLQIWDPIASRHRMIANNGYTAEQTDHLDTWFVGHDEAYRYMREVDNAPLRWADMPFDYTAGFSAVHYWLPAGYKEGVTTCLFSADGRYTGNLHLNTDSTRHPSDPGMGGLLALQKILGDFTDVLREPARAATAIAPDSHAAFVGRDGRVHALPGRMQGPWLSADRSLVESLRSARSDSPNGWKGVWCDPQGSWHRVTQNCSPMGYVVTERSAARPFGLTPREVDVLDRVVSGSTNSHIARVLSISAKTVAKHVENIMEKTGVESRTAAAVLAVEDGVRLLRAGELDSTARS